MPLIKGGRFVADPWCHLEDGDAVPPALPVTVSYKRWQAERALLLERAAPLGLRLPNDASAMALAADRDRLALIVLNFPRFTDGRAYSQARLIRGRLGYTGELRASGDVLRDQLLFMRRCGFDAFAVNARADAENWLRAFREIDVFYQPGEDQSPWAMRQRAHAAALR
jgi:uncharacterized protein (DUF934 family)